MNVLRAVPSLVAKTMKIGDFQIGRQLRHVVPHDAREDDRAKLCSAELLIL